MTPQEIVERCAGIADAVAELHGNLKGTLVAGSYSAEAETMAHVNAMATANDIAAAIRGLLSEIEESQVGNDT
jgi:uncharacterized protein YgfB (UPF0149 family)